MKQEQGVKWGPRWVEDRETGVEDLGPGIHNHLTCYLKAKGLRLAGIPHGRWSDTSLTSPHSTPGSYHSGSTVCHPISSRGILLSKSYGGVEEMCLTGSPR